MTSRIRYDKALDLIIRQTHEKQQVLFVAIKNLGVEVSQLREETQKCTRLFLALLNDPQARHEIEAVARDLRIQTYKKNT